MIVRWFPKRALWYMHRLNSPGELRADFGEACEVVASKPPIQENHRLTRKLPSELIELAFDGWEYRLKDPCLSSAMNGNIWCFGIFRFSQDLGYQTVVRRVSASWRPGLQLFIEIRT